MLTTDIACPYETFVNLHKNLGVTAKNSLNLNLHKNLGVTAKNSLTFHSLQTDIQISHSSHMT
jgi:hypothetical protein